MSSRDERDEVGGGHRTEKTGESERRSQEPSTDGSGPSSQNDWFQITFSVPWLVRGAKQPQDAINITISEVGKQLAAVEDPIRDTDITIQQVTCTECGTSTEGLLLIAETALVGVLLTVTVRAGAAAAAEALARRAIGPHLPDTPFTTVDVSRSSSSAG
ncbi:MAG: DUF555 domain-containing protein [Halobacteriales archaeon]|nr:DUF555 domain-containing protein [Halobacteriales archaeon]